MRWKTTIVLLTLLQIVVVAQQPPAFDTLKVATTLEESGFSQAKAHALAEALVEVTTAGSADKQTKSAALQQRTETNAQDAVIAYQSQLNVQELRAELSLNVQEVRTELSNQIATTGYWMVAWLTGLIVGAVSFVVALSRRKTGP